MKYVLVSIFWVIWRKVMHTREAPDFWGLHKNMNCEFPLILVMSANHASRTRFPDCSKLATNRELTMKSLFVDKKDDFLLWRQVFFHVLVFLLPSLVTGPSFMCISLPVLELRQFFCKGLARNPEIENATVWVLSNICRTGTNISN